MRPDWTDYFLALADTVSARSPDPATKHGCVIVDEDNRVIATGYNGPLAGVDAPTTRPEKYDWFLHSEENAVIFARRDLSGCTAYVTGHPCVRCTRMMLQAGIRMIYHGQRETVSVSEEEKAVAVKMIVACGGHIVEWFSAGD